MCYNYTSLYLKMPKINNPSLGPFEASELDEWGVGNPQSELAQSVRSYIDSIVEISPEILYGDLIRRDIPSVVTAWGLVSVIDHCKETLSEMEPGNPAKYEKRVIKSLLKAFKAIPFKKWAFFPKVMANESSSNCSGAAFLFGHILKEDLDIPVKHVNPYGHAALVARLSDGKDYYIDPRNGQFYRIKLDNPLSDQDGFTIYQIDRRRIDHQLLAVSDFELGAVYTLLENFNQ